MRRGRQFRNLCAALLLCLLAGRSVPAQEPVIVDLSNHLVAITTGFAGTDVLLFGAADEFGDVVVVVRGPLKDIVVHRKSRVLGVWANTASMTFARAPSFYAVAASRPLAEIAPESVLKRHQLGMENLALRLPRNLASPNLAAEWRAALIRNQQRQGLYAGEVEKVRFLGGRLFRTRFSLPANVPTGDYQVEVYLLRYSEVVGAQITPLQVAKTGLEADIFDFAHQQAPLYGVIAILVALVAGWLGNAIFRKA